MRTILRQVVDGRRHEAALLEPVRRARGQHEQLRHAGRAGAVFHVLQDAFAVALGLRVRAHGQARHLGHLRFRERVQRGAAEDDAVVLDHGKLFDLAFDQLARTFHERAVRLQRFDELDNPADVLN